jgi:hypothetical protein
VAGIYATNYLVGCSEEKSSNPIESVIPAAGNTQNPFDTATDLRDQVGSMAAAQYWGDRIVSEAFYALNQNRTGGSSVSYHGCAMGDWDYIASDEFADKRIASYVGGCGYRGSARGFRTMSDWDGSSDRCAQGGHCWYFANLVLFRSSYGWGGNMHLVLPSPSTSGYATKTVRSAQPGWVLQAHSPTKGPHTAIVVAANSGGLSLVDANYVGSDGGWKFLIARHDMSWSQLDSWGFKAYCPWETPKLIARSGPTVQCF